MMITRVYAAAFALVTLACGGHASTPLATIEAYTLQQAADSIPLSYGREVQVGDVWMVLTDVPAESRCPRDVVCVQAGDATAMIAVHPPCYKAGCKAPSVMLELHTTREPRSAEGWGYRVRLLALLPEPVSTQPTGKSRYVAWVRVTKAA
jgi:hypothetical protein